MTTITPVSGSASASTSSTQSRLSVLEQRLEEGYARIEQALQQGGDVERWESFWITLLKEYEALCDGFAEAA